MRAFTLPPHIATATLITQPAGAETSEATNSTLVVAFKDDAARQMLKDAGIEGNFDSLEAPVRLESGKRIPFYRNSGGTKQTPGSESGKYFGRTERGVDVHVQPVHGQQIDGVYVEMKVFNPQLPPGDPDRLVTCLGVIPDVARLNLACGVNVLHGFLKTHF